MRRITRLLIPLALVAGCTSRVPTTTDDVPGTPVRGVPAVVAATPRATARPAAGPASMAPGATPGPVASAGSSVPVDQRTMADRTDDGGDFQVHLLYVLPADGTDKQLDTSGAIATSAKAANRWMSDQTGGRTLRLDTFGGEPDVTFFRTPETHASLGPDSAQRTQAIERELIAAGFNQPNKIYAFYYGGGSQRTGSVDPVAIGYGGHLYAGVYLKEAPDPLATDVQHPDVFEYTLLHECLHALGFVPGCAPHATQDDHVADDPDDLMSALMTHGIPVLDAAHDDYYDAGIAGCLDLSQSPFLDPRPDVVAPPVGLPLGLDAGSNATPLAASATAANTPGNEAVEASAFAALNAERARLGLPPLTLDPRLTVAARLAGPGTARAAELGAQCGFAGTFGYAGVSSDGGADDAASSLLASPDVRQIAGDASVTGVGVGVTRSDKLTYVEVAYANARLQADSATLGEGPANTYTLSVALRPLGGVTGIGEAFLDDEPAAPFTVGAGTVRVTIPRHGSHKVTFGIEAADGVTYQTELIYHVDGDQPVGQALTAS